MLLTLFISTLITSLHLVNSNTVLEYRDQEEPHRELMIDQPQKVSRGGEGRGGEGKGGLPKNLHIYYKGLFFVVVK